MASACFETICLKNRQLQNLDQHTSRLNRTREMLWGANYPISLEDELKVPEHLTNGVYKCRVTFSECIEQVEWEPYTMRNIRSLQVVEDNQISYSFKYKDRTALQSLFQLRGDCDEILIVKNGYLTDTSIGNIALYNGQQWVTPEYPLLPGTRRAQLLAEGVIQSGIVLISDLQTYSRLKIFNSMISWSEAPSLSLADGAIIL